MSKDDVLGKVVIETLFEEVRQCCLSAITEKSVDDSKEDKAEYISETLSDDLLSKLYFTFQTPVEHALDLVDQNAVTRLINVICPDHFVFQVSGNSGSIYTCFPETNFCTCPYYKFSILKKYDALLCKHVLAARLAICLQTCKDVAVSGPDFSKLLMEL